MRVPGRKEKFTNVDLPTGSQDGGAWRRLFVPTYLQYLASRSEDVKDAWTIKDDEVVLNMQKIWDFTYGARIPYDVTVAGSVFFIVCIFMHFTW